MINSQKVAVTCHFEQSEESLFYNILKRQIISAVEMAYTLNSTFCGTIKDVRIENKIFRD